MNEKKKHLHIYERIRGKGGANTRYRCIDPDCTHLQFATHIIGKRVLCSICKLNELIIKPDDVRRKHFRCLDCSNTKEAAELRTKKVLVDKLLNKRVFGEKEEEETFSL